MSRKQSSSRPPSKEARKRNKAVTFLLLPLLVFLWIVGGCLYWITPGKAQTKRARTVETGKSDFVPAPGEKLVKQQTGS